MTPLCKSRQVESFLAIHTERPIWRDVPIERLPRDPELFAERADARITLSHTRHREPQLRGRHLRLAPADAPARTGGREAGARALGDELALELGERGEDAEDELAGGITVTLYLTTKHNSLCQRSVRKHMGLSKVSPVTPRSFLGGKLGVNQANY